MNHSSFIQWLNEMHRCLKIGGKLIFTYHGPTAFEKIKSHDMSSKLNIIGWNYEYLHGKFLKDKFVWLAQSVGSEDIDGRSYGISFTNLEFIQEVSGAKFEFLHDINEVGGWQDLVVLQKI